MNKLEKKLITIKFLNYKGSTFAMTSGASAIEIAASLLRLKKYDEVIIPSHTYCATALPFTRYNCQIRWADIVPEIGLLLRISVFSFCEVCNPSCGTVPETKLLLSIRTLSAASRISAAGRLPRILHDCKHSVFVIPE